jgi:hypothetical protein
MKKRRPDSGRRFFVPYNFASLIRGIDTGKFPERHEMILSFFFNIF